jgi:hypothetical protein
VHRKHASVYDVPLRMRSAAGCLVQAEVTALRLRRRQPGVHPGQDPARGMPRVYELGPDLRPDALGGQYLDPHAAREAIEAIRIQSQATLGRIT